MRGHINALLFTCGRASSEDYERRVLTSVDWKVGGKDTVVGCSREARRRLCCPMAPPAPRPRGHYIYTGHVGGICNSRINIVVGIKGVRRINTGRRAYCRRTARYRKNSDAVTSSRSCFCRGTKLPHPCASHVATQSVGVLSNGGRRPP